MYDKDSDDFNMMDDINFNGSPADEPNINQENSPETEDLSALDEKIFTQGESLDDMAIEAQYQKDNNPSQKKGSKSPILGVILLLALILAGAITFIYAENIPYVSDAVAKVKKLIPQQIKKSDVKKSDIKEIDIINIEDLANNTQPGSMPANSDENSQDDISKLLNETSEDTGITITRNKKMPEVEKPRKPGEIRVEDEFLPPLPGTEQLPKLPNENIGMQPEKEKEIVYRYSKSNVGRPDPFNPTSKTSQLSDIIAPPTNPDPDPEAAALLTLKISGIMYTPDSPSAIINISGQDQLVRIGDKFNNFSVEKITKDKVTVRNKANTYTASVGEILNLESVGINAVPDLNNKFAGQHAKNKDRIIEINTLN